MYLSLIDKSFNKSGVFVPFDAAIDLSGVAVLTTIVVDATNKDKLFAIAADKYGNVDMLQYILLFNNIKDSTSIPIGTELMLPVPSDLEERIITARQAKMSEPLAKNISSKSDASNTNAKSQDSANVVRNAGRLVYSKNNTK